MNKWMKLGTVLALGMALSTACGDDDDGDKGGADGCYFKADDTCHATAGISAACGALGGEAKACPTTNLEGTCAYTEDGQSTTVYYYKGADGSAWDDGFGTAKEDCEDVQDGTYSAK